MDERRREEEMRREEEARALKREEERLLYRNQPQLMKQSIEIARQRRQQVGTAAANAVLTILFLM